MEHKSIWAALHAAKQELGKVPKDSTNPFFKSKYFDINGLLDVVEPILHKHGLVVIQPIQGGQVVTKVVHAATGEYIQSELELSKSTDPQKHGSEITYYRRYTLQSLLAMQADDDDGNAASGRNKPAQQPESTKQPEQPKILDLINEYNNLVEQNKNLYTADELAQLNPKADWDEKKYAANLGALKQGIEKRKAAKNA